jgi:hypothetical protein
MARPDILLAMKVLAALLTASLTLAAADVTGAWVCEVQTEAGNGSPRFEFQQTGDNLKGKYSGQLGDADLTGKIAGDKIGWTFSISGGTIVYEGTIADGAIKGKVDLAGQASGTFACKRK